MTYSSSKKTGTGRNCVIPSRDGRDNTLQGVPSRPAVPQSQITRVLRPERGVNPILAFRRLLKYAARSCGLRCMAVRSDPALLEQPLQGDVACTRRHARKK